MARKKQEKSSEEKAAEGNFRVDVSDLKYATEKEIKKALPKENILKNITQKEVKGAQAEIIEKGSIKKNSRKPGKKDIEKIEQFTVLKKKFKKSKKAKEYSAPKIELKERGYELIITEKPQAALKIANALGKAVQKNISKVPYYEVNRNGKEIFVACAVGHLFTLKQKNNGYSIPVFDISWVPNYLARKGDFTKRYYDVILKLAKEAQSLIVATDYDIEGEVIGLNIIRYICNQPDAYRMKFSTLTQTELEKAYDNKSPHIDWGQAIAGETRHYLDWFYGINLSRSLMNAIKTTGKFRIMSIGRVQGPTLHLIVSREKEIMKFKPQPFWQVSITVDNKKNQIELKYIKDIFDKSQLKPFENLKGKKATAETIKKQEALHPPAPFNLTTLQTEEFKAEKLITRNKPVEGAKTDPAHPSIYPTGNKQFLSGDEDKIYKLIVKRFLSLFCDDALVDNKTIKAEINGLVFSKRGQS